MKPLHILLAISTSAIWGVNFVITKIGLAELPPIFFTCLRYTAVAFPLVFFIPRGGVRWQLILQVGVCLGTLTFTLAFIGIHLGVPAGLTALLMQGQVIATLLFSALLLGDRPGLPLVIGVLVSLAGVGILALDYAGTRAFIGLLFVLGGSVCAGFNNIILKRGGDYDPFKLTIWMSLVPPIPLLLLSLVFETGQWQSLAAITYRGAGAVLFNAYISTVLGFAGIAYLIRLYPPNTVAPYAFLVPVFGIAAGYLMLGERLDAPGLLACLLIMTGLLTPWLVGRIRGG